MTLVLTRNTFIYCWSLLMLDCLYFVLGLRPCLYLYLMKKGQKPWEALRTFRMTTCLCKSMYENGNISECQSTLFKSLPFVLNRKKAPPPPNYVQKTTFVSLYYISEVWSIFFGIKTPIKTTIKTTTHENHCNSKCNYQAMYSSAYKEIDIPLS